jgi:hypothetical protein
MSIAMERFGSNEQLWESRVSSGSRGPAFPYRLQCRSCGFEPEDAITRPRRCPKCHGSAWERFAFPRSLLTTAERCTSNRAESEPEELSLYWSQL